MILHRYVRRPVAAGIIQGFNVELQEKIDGKKREHPLAACEIRLELGLGSI